MPVMSSVHRRMLFVFLVFSFLLSTPVFSGNRCYSATESVDSAITLYQFTAAQKTPAPDYTYIEIPCAGRPVKQEFQATASIILHTGQVIQAEGGRASSKKAARALAAHKLLEKLSQTPEWTTYALQHNSSSAGTPPLAGKRSNLALKIRKRVDATIPDGVYLRRTSLYPGAGLLVLMINTSQGAQSPDLEQRLEAWKVALESEFQIKVLLYRSWFIEKGLNDLLNLADTHGVIRSPTAATEVPTLGVPYATRVSIPSIRGWEPSRVDLRSDECVSIDPVNSQDLDDALSATALPNGHTRINIHVADIAALISDGSKIDLNARAQGFSIYGASRTVPMFPPEIAFGMSSLLPGVDRLAWTVSAEIDQTGAVVSHKVFRSVIRNRARFSYERLPEHLFEAITKAQDIADPVLKTLVLLRDTTPKLAAARSSQGILFDDVRHIKDEHSTTSNRAHAMVEEYMLLANRLVAEDLRAAGTPTLYRVHTDLDAPATREALKEKLISLGFLPQSASVVDAVALRNALLRLQETAEFRSNLTGLGPLFGQAEYSANPQRHFALGLGVYTHFTSPIRRYPDVVVQRQLAALLYGEAATPESELIPLQTLLNRQQNQVELESSKLSTYDRIARALSLIGQHYAGEIIYVRSYEVGIEVPDLGSGILDGSFHFTPEQVTEIRGGILPAEAKHRRNAVEVELVGYDLIKNHPVFRVIKTNMRLLIP